MTGPSLYRPYRVGCRLSTKLDLKSHKALRLPRLTFCIFIYFGIFAADEAGIAECQRHHGFELTIFVRH